MAIPLSQLLDFGRPLLSIASEVDFMVQPDASRFEGFGPVALGHAPKIESAIV
jgi:hypothetical protein